MRSFASQESRTSKTEVRATHFCTILAQVKQSITCLERAPANRPHFGSRGLALKNARHVALLVLRADYSSFQEGYKGGNLGGDMNHL